jgi:hypothetical protein
MANGRTLQARSACGLIQEELATSVAKHAPMRHACARWIEPHPELFAMAFHFSRSEIFPLARKPKRVSEGGKASEKSLSS